MKKFLLAAFCLLTISSFAQHTYFSYTTGAPVGTFKDFVSDYSWKGFEIGYQKDWGANTTIGFQYRYMNFFEKKDRGTYEFDNGAITTTLFTYSFVNSFHGTLNYNYYNDSRVTPYAGLAAGLAYVRNRLIVGFISLEDGSTRVSLSPQIGALIKLSEYVDMDLKVSYNYIPMQYENFNNLSYIGASIGFSWLSY